MLFGPAFANVSVSLPAPRSIEFPAAVSAVVSTSVSAPLLPRIDSTFATLMLFGPAFANVRVSLPAPRSIEFPAASDAHSSKIQSHQHLPRSDTHHTKSILYWQP